MALTPEQEESEIANIQAAVNKAAELYIELATAHIAMPGLNAVSGLMTRALYQSNPSIHMFNHYSGGVLSELLRQVFSETFLAGVEFGKAGQTLSKVAGECDDPNCPGNHARRN